MRAAPAGRVGSVQQAAGQGAWETKPNSWLVPIGNAASVRALSWAAVISHVSFPDVLSGTVTFLPLEEDDQGNWKVQMSNVYQVQLSRSDDEW